MATDIATYLTANVPEGTTAVITATIKDDAGVPIPAASLTTLRLWLYDRVKGSAINSRTNQDILNLNGCTVDANGLATLTLGPTDNVVVHAPSGRREEHVAAFEWSYASGAKKGRHEVHFDVANLAVLT